jgi:putative lipoprotein
MGLEWSLVSLKGQPAATGNRGKRLTLRLTDDGIAAGFAGCNQFTAKFTNSGSELKLEPTVTTKMACPRGMTLERAYLDVLHQVRGWRRNGNQLELLADDQVVAVYERA